MEALQRQGHLGEAGARIRDEDGERVGVEGETLQAEIDLTLVLSVLSIYLYIHLKNPVNIPELILVLFHPYLEISFH